MAPRRSAAHGAVVDRLPGLHGRSGVLASANRGQPGRGHAPDGPQRGVPRCAAVGLRRRRRFARERCDPPAAAQGDGRRAEERDGGAAQEGRRREAADRPRRRRRGQGRPARHAGSAQQPDELHRLPRLVDRRLRPDDRDQRAQRPRALRSHLGGRGQRRPDARPGAADRAVRDRRAVPDHRGDGADRRLRARQVADRIGARAVCRHRARAAGRLHAQDRGARPRISSASSRCRSTR